MKLSEKIYMLRKKSGLSQEQLAEQLDVSRQAISKWESGVSAPEREKLVTVAAYFGVSVDYLVRDEWETPEESAASPRICEAEAITRYVGLGFCVLGFICLIVWGIVILANPSVSDGIAQSSVITIDGRGIILAFCIVLVAIGVILLLKKTKRR